MLLSLLMMLIPVAAVAAVGLRTFRGTMGELEGLRQGSIHESESIERVEGLLVQADDLGEAYSESQEPALAYQFTLLAGEIARGFDELQAFHSQTERGRAILAEGLWERARAALDRAIASSGNPAVQSLDEFHDNLDRAAADVADLAFLDTDEIAAQVALLEKGQSAQLLVFLGMVLATALGAYVLSRWVRRRITAPLSLLEDGSRRLGADDLTHRIPVEGDDELARASNAFNEMAEKLQVNREQLQYQAVHDPLTNLPNRTLFFERLKLSIARAARRGTPVSVLYLDLDDFKAVNDTLGHEAGDDLLIRVAGCLASSIRGEDTAGRLGRDEFGVLIEEDLDGATRTADRLLELFRGSCTESEAPLAIGATIGISTWQDGQELDELLRQAEAAMHAAKASGKGGWQVFGDGAGAELLAAHELRAELDRALEREEFLVHYQPVVNLESGAVDGVEALVRWNHPERGVLAPAEFLDEAEKAGHISRIDGWVLRESCRQVRDWQLRIPGAANLGLNVNVSGRQLHSPGLADDVAQVLRMSGLAPESLTVEITETALVQDADVAANELRKLDDQGVKLALDDFGTGFSSLSYLLRFPIDEIKIDRSFVMALEDGEASDLVLALVNLGSTLGLRVVAEGIENEHQLDYLRSIGCAQGQGYYFAKPLGAALMEPVLELGCSVREVEPVSELTELVPA